MANLVSEITEFLGPQIVGRIASSLGLDKTLTQKAIAAAVPGLLAALISLVSKPQGATKLRDAVAEQEPGVLSRLASVIGQPGQRALIDNGASVLSSLLGGKAESGLVQALGQYAGIGDGGSKGLMGLLGPIVLGVLGNQQRSSGLDAAGLARLVTSQKDAVRAALPSGFSKYLNDTGILDNLVGSTPKPAYSSSSGSSFPWRWLLAALALLGVGLLAWRLLSGPHQDVVETPSSKIEVPYADLFAKLRGVKVGDVDIGELATSAVNGLNTPLDSIKDEPTAQAALPELTKTTSQFDELIGLLGQLSPDNRKLVAETFAASRPGLDRLLEKVLGIPGVSAVIKPTVDVIRAKLDTLAAG